MPYGRTYMGNARNYKPGTLSTAFDMESKEQTEATPVIKYQLSPEEMEKYKPIPRKEKGK